MTQAARLFKRALAEHLTKTAFVPLGKHAQQAPGPGGAPVDPAMMGGDPAMGGMPMDPAMAGGAPMDPAMMADPAAAGMPMDPAMAGGAPPMDPAMAGAAPPVDPAMGGMPPMDPAMLASLAAPAPAAPSSAGLTAEDEQVVDKITKRTMDIVRQTLEMVGKAKKPESADAAAPAGQPGPVTGMPGFDPSSIKGPLA
jgi:hypothetical protein